MRVDLRTPAGMFVARLDLAWPEVKVAVEYDGAEWHDERHRQRDERRRAQLEALGWHVIVLDADDYANRRDAVAAEVSAAIRLRRQGKSVAT